MKIEMRDIEKVRPYESNPRLNDKAVDAVAASLREFGFRQPIVVDADGVIVVGHTRWKAAKKLGLDQVPVHVAKDLTPEQAKAYRIADNKTADLATWDFELLPGELAELQALDVDLGLLGFSEDELAELLDPGVKAGLCDPDAVPEPPDEAITQPGDLWIMGDHRLLCGDSSSPTDVDFLIAADLGRVRELCESSGESSGKLTEAHGKAYGSSARSSAKLRAAQGSSGECSAKLSEAQREAHESSGESLEKLSEAHESSVRSSAKLRAAQGSSGECSAKLSERLTEAQENSGKSSDKLRKAHGSSASMWDILPIHLVNCDPPYNVRVEPRSNNAIAAGLSSFGEHGLMHHQSFDMHRAEKRRGSKKDEPKRTASKYHGFDVATGGQSGKATHRKMRPKDRPLANDFVSDEAFDQMLQAWFGNIARVLLPGRAAYIWGGYANIVNYPPVLKACGLYFSQTIIWHKQWPVLTRKDFMGDHEWCFYTWREGAAHVFLGPNNATDVWSVKKVTPNSMVHLTEKPVELAVRAIQYSSRVGENVLDLFGGSGSTLIAAEQTGRRAFLMELDPLYCDVIVQRWEKFSGRKAERAAVRDAPAASPEACARMS